MKFSGFTFFMIFLTMVCAIFLIIESNLAPNPSSLMQAAILIIIFCSWIITTDFEVRLKELERKLDDILRSVQVAGEVNKLEERRSEVD
jgi:Flp pilus assembly protein TadB